MYRLRSPAITHTRHPLKVNISNVSSTQTHLIPPTLYNGKTTSHEKITYHQLSRYRGHTHKNHTTYDYSSKLFQTTYNHTHTGVIHIYHTTLPLKASHIHHLRHTLSKSPDISTTKIATPLSKTRQWFTFSLP